MKYFGGCDAGSTYTKCVILDENGKIAADVTLRSRINAVLSAREALDQAVAKVPELNGADDLTYLVGTGYRSYVNYWMPFNGGIGLHDATWRSEFGGDIYMYDGSHGCVNLPLANAGVIYNNVSAGTKVIVYGGERTTGKLTQEFTGTQSYTVTTDDMPFQLDVKVKYTSVDLHYASSNSNVVTVDGMGNVTIVGGGEATITVTSDAKGSLEKSVFQITIFVEGEPVETEPTEPDVTEPDVTEPDVTEPDVTEPDVTEPQVTAPETTDPQ